MTLPKITTLLLILSKLDGIKCFMNNAEGKSNAMTKILKDEINKESKIPPASKIEDDADIFANPPLRNKLLGTHEECTVDYWSRPDIHTLGNVGFGGAVHAAMAPIATKLIDVKAYGGIDVRALISQELRAKVNKVHCRVIDLCSGVGMSTRAVANAFHDAEYVVGVDTSPEMIDMASAISKHERGYNIALERHSKALSTFMREGLDVFSDLPRNEEIDKYPTFGKCQPSYRVLNAESTSYPSGLFDLVTIMYGFHEIPKQGRAKIIQEAHRILCSSGYLAILDICPTYEPSKYMLAGEPFVLEYKQNIDSQLANSVDFDVKKRVVVSGHVNLWLLTKRS